MAEPWEAGIDVDVLENGCFAPVLLLVPPSDVGAPLRRRLEGGVCPSRASQNGGARRLRRDVPALAFPTPDCDEVVASVQGP